MTEKVTNSRKISRVRRLVAEERALLQEKASLEQMLKNVQGLRTKLKVEQIQLSSHLQVELGRDTAVNEPVESLPSPNALNIQEEENNIVVNKPSLNLNVDSFQQFFFGADAEGEEDEEDSSEDEIGCAQEVMDETEINFDDF